LRQRVTGDAFEGIDERGTCRDIACRQERLAADEQQVRVNTGVACREGCASSGLGARGNELVAVEGAAG
jgi:hypothetical protein